MSKKVLTFICLASFISLGNFAAVPNLTKCLSTDNKCLKSSAQAILPMFAMGLPEYGVEPLDPVVFKKPIDASVAGLKLIINNFVVKGLKDCVLKKISRDVPNSKLMGKILCNVVGDGDYEMDGQLLILKVQGKGKIHVVLRKIAISLEADMGEKVKDGVKYWDVKRFTHSFELMDKADVVFENLFTGNDVLGRAASQVLESSGNDIINEVGPPVIKVISTRVVETIRKFFNHVPSEDLALD